MTEQAMVSRADELVDDMTLEEKASLTGGRTVWKLPGVARLDIAPLKMSDGPSGVRGEQFHLRRSLSFPCGMAAGATWDVDLLGRYGAALAAEARSKGVHLLLGPTICIPRTPLAGRTFESFAEDPHLTARLTVAYVGGVQSGGVGACVKHFACNDQEHERMSISAEVDERTLREVHLPAFEAAVREAGVWAVMSAYNRLGGTYCGEHPDLLGRILKDEWRFDGVVVSDWFGTHSTVGATEAGLDIEMPGPPRYLGPALAEAVVAGDVEPAVLDDHARRIVNLIDRTGAFGPQLDREGEEDDPGRRALARELASSGSVLLRNHDDTLPLDAAAVSRIALIGPNADPMALGGGGSSAVSPLQHRSLVDEVRSWFPETEVTVEEGCPLAGTTAPMPPHLLDGPITLAFSDGAGGDVVGTEVAHQPRYLTLGDPMRGLSVKTFSVFGTGSFIPDRDGLWRIGLANAGRGRLLVDGEVIIDNTENTSGGSTFFGMGCDPVFAARELHRGHSYSLQVELEAIGHPMAGFEVYADPPEVPDAFERAVDAARAADVAVVVVGANAQSETEGEDRASLQLLGDQDALVHAVAQACARTVVVLNAGAPVEMPWIDNVAAVLNVWYPGEEGPAAVADMLRGDTEPTGRLPITYPARLSDGATTTPTSYPGVDGKVVYEEGLLVGYRHFDAHDIEPLFPFGFGLGYTAFDYGTPALQTDNGTRRVEVPVTNTGSRFGTTVVQAYVGSTDRDAARPVRQLGGFVKVGVAAGETTTVSVPLDERAFSRWDTDVGSWVVDAGRYEIAIGQSSRDLDHIVSVDIEP